ncbi:MULTISPECIES: NINE protein [unclassified Cryobacterium]|uniref:NINE protein n=1 Tax=unclassified Cryobacterium TaxID=2649013 RepID=UPI0018E07A9F|nr:MULTISPECIES: NINE protein [unclassified Cryobacterium]
MPQEVNPPAGMYRDPEDPALDRWWNGEEWTAHTNRAAQLETPQYFRMGTAYLFWFFLGGVGAHHFYLDRDKTGFLMLFSTIGAWILTGISLSNPYWQGIQLVLFVPIGIGVTIDVFLIPHLTRHANTLRAQRVAFFQDS